MDQSLLKQVRAATEILRSAVDLKRSMVRFAWEVRVDLVNIKGSPFNNQMPIEAEIIIGVVELALLALG